MTARRRISTMLASGCVLALLTACGSSGESPADAVPALAQALERVDDAVVAQDDTAAREALAALVDEAEAAAEAGDLDQAEAQRVVDAAEVVLARLDPEPAPADETDPPEEPTEDTEPNVEEPEGPGEPEPGGPEKPGKPEKPEKPGKGPKPGKGHGRDD